MNTQTLSIARALPMIKALDQEINDFISQKLPLIGLSIGSVSKKPWAPNLVATKEEEARAAFQSNMDTYDNLVNKRRALKAAVNVSNALAKIKIDPFPEMTVAEALELKKSLKQREALALEIQRQVVALNTEANKLANAYQQAVQAQIKDLISPEMDQAARQTIWEETAKRLEATMAVSTLDPNGLVERYSKLIAENKVLKGEIDIRFTEHNTATMITINW